MSVPALRPLGIGEILDVAIKITTRHWWTLVRIVLIVVVPLQVLSTAIDLSAAGGAVTTGGETGFDETTGEIDTGELWTFIAAIVAAVTLSLLAQTVATGACFKAVADAYLGREPDWRRSLAATFRRLHSIIWISILTYVLGGLGLLLFIIPGIWLFISWTVAVPALLTEGVKGWKALTRSFRLVRDYWWRTLALVLLGSILAGIVTFALGAALGALTFAADSDAALAAASLAASIVAGAITTPFVAAMTIVLYIDLRVRKEGFDLALLAERFGEPGSSGEAGSFVPSPPPAELLPPLPQPNYGPQSGGAQPPFWPPPPGWRPDGEER